MPVLDKLLTVSIKYLQKKQKALRRKNKKKKKKASRKKKKTLKRGVRRKKARKQPRRKRKPVKKTTKKRPARKKKATKKRSVRKKRAPRKKKSVRKKLKPRTKNVKPKGAAPVQKAPKEEKIGHITHYFSKIQVVVVKISKGKMRVGDTIRIAGSTTDFRQKVKSLQIESVDVKEGKKGQLVGLKVKKKAKEGDDVFVVK